MAFGGSVVAAVAAACPRPLARPPFVVFRFIMLLCYLSPPLCPIGAGAFTAPRTPTVGCPTLRTPAKRRSLPPDGPLPAGAIGSQKGRGGESNDAAEGIAGDDADNALDASRMLATLTRVLRIGGDGDGDGDPAVHEGPTADLLPMDPAARSSPKNDVKAQYRDLSEDGFGPLLPVAEKVDELTGGWGLSYADLAPETPSTPLGQAFLATNAFYALAGLGLAVKGDLVLGAMTEVAGVVSFWYHYSQLNFGQDRKEVRLALLTDYFTASTALITGGIYMAQMGITHIPLDVVTAGGLSVACLSLSWVWEFGYSYLFWHSLWHILSAYSGYLVGQYHMDNMLVAASGAAMSLWLPI